MGPHVFGLYAIAWSILSMVGLLGLLGLDRGVIRFGVLAREDASAFKTVFWQSLLISATVGLLLGVAVYFAAPWLAMAVFSEPELEAAFRWLAPGFVLLATMKVVASATRISGKMSYSVVAEDLIQPGLHLLFIVILGLAGYRLFGAITAGVLSLGAGLCSGLIFFWRLYSAELGSSMQRRSLLDVGNLIRFSVPTAMAGTFTFITFRVDRLIIGFFRPAAEVGYYQAASQCAIVFAIILSAFSAALMPLVVDLHNRMDSRSLESIFKAGTRWGFYLSIPIFLVLVLHPSTVLAALFGHQYAAAAQVLQVLACAQLINVATGSVDTLLIMTGHQKRWMTIALASLAVNILLGALLVYFVGTIGAAVAGVVTLSLLFGSGLFVVRSRLGVWPYDREYGRGIASALITAVVLFLTGLIPFPNVIIATVTLCAVSAIVFVGCILIAGLGEQDRDLIKTLFPKARFVQFLR